MIKHFLQQNRLLIGMPSLAIVLILVVYILRPNSLGYQLNGTQSVILVNDPSGLVEIKDLSGKQLIDIRPAELYTKGHPDGAINIPLRMLMDEEVVEIFDQFAKEKKEAVLFGADELQATAPLFLLQQLGYHNIKQLKGGYSDKNVFTEPAIGSNEQMQLDPALIHANKVTTDQEVNTPKKVEVVVPRKKEVTKGGGC